MAEGYDTKRVYGLEEDARTFCRAICQWLDENDRWGSPLYIFGESYGTMRSAVLMRYLGEAHVPLAGVVMLSAYYDWTQNLPGNDLYYVGMVPTFASTAQYFGLVGQGVDEDEWFDRASAFAGGEYARGIFLGDEITPADKDALAAASMPAASSRATRSTLPRRTPWPSTCPPLSDFPRATCLPATTELSLRTLGRTFSSAVALCVAVLTSASPRPRCFPVSVPRSTLPARILPTMRLRAAGMWHSETS